MSEEITTRLCTALAGIDSILGERLETARQQADELREDLEAVRQVRVSIQRKAEEMERIYNTACQNVDKLVNEYERIGALQARAAAALVLTPPASPQAPKRAIRAIKDTPRLREKLALSATPVVNREVCGVYFLLRDREVVYVGQSVNVLGRLATHISDGTKRFDRWCYITAKKDELDELEGFYITLLRPEHNIVGKPILTVEFPVARSLEVSP